MVEEGTEVGWKCLQDMELQVVYELTSLPDVCRCK